MAYARAFGALPLAGLAPTLGTLAFMLALLAIAILWLTGETSFMLVTLSLIVATLVLSLVRGFGVMTEEPERGTWFVFHAAASLLGIASLGVAFVAAALYVAQHRALKERRFGVIFQVFPPLEELDRVNYVALLAGFPILSVGIALAVVFMDRSADAVSEWAVHVGWGALAWIVLGAVAGSRLFGWLRGKRAAYASIAGFVAVSVIFLLLRMLAVRGAQFL